MDGRRKNMRINFGRTLLEPNYLSLHRNHTDANNYMLIKLIIFRVADPRKTNPLFLFVANHCNQELRF